MKKKSIFTIAVFVIIAIVAFIFIQGNTNKTETISIRSGKIKNETIVEKLSTTGTLIPNQTQALAGAGNVLGINNKIGDRVEKDTVLATYDNGFQLVAPFNGTITQLNIRDKSPDTSAQLGKPAIQIDDLSSLKVQLQLSNSEAAAVTINQKVDIMSNGQTYEGKISEKNPVATNTQTATGTTAVLGAIATFNKTPENWFAGFDVDVDITTNIAENVLALPIEALTYNDKNEPIVYVVKGDLAKKTKISIGIQSDKLVEIKSGLKVGQTVVLSPSSDIKDNTEVTKE